MLSNNLILILVVIVIVTTQIVISTIQESVINSRGWSNYWTLTLMDRLPKLYSN